jgi:hypothetical protein
MVEAVTTRPVRSIGWGAVRAIISRCLDRVEQETNVVHHQGATVTFNPRSGGRSPGN